MYKLWQRKKWILIRQSDMLGCLYRHQFSLHGIFFLINWGMGTCLDSWHHINVCLIGFGGPRQASLPPTVTPKTWHTWATMYFTTDRKKAYTSPSSPSLSLSPSLSVSCHTTCTRFVHNFKTFSLSLSPYPSLATPHVHVLYTTLKLLSPFSLSPSNLLHICRHHHGRRLPWRRWVNRTGIGVIPFVSANVHHEETMSHTHTPAKQEEGRGLVSLQRWIIDESVLRVSNKGNLYEKFEMKRKLRGDPPMRTPLQREEIVFYNQAAMHGPI